MFLTRSLFAKREKIVSPNLSDLPPIYFYIPREDWPTDSIPETPNVYWPNFGGGITAGVYAWTVQTYQYLKARGLPCQLVGELPSEGIVFSHRRSMPDDFKPGPNVLFVCLKAERNRHSYAQLHVVGNPLDLQPQSLLPGDQWLLSNERQYIPHWPQPGLIPRDPERGDRFENIAFFGEGRNVAPEFHQPSWVEHLNALGLTWHLVDRDRRARWNDFSYVDVIIAVRQFHNTADYAWKPALKLYNAWHAGIPAILGQGESAYRLERRSNLDYIEVNTLDETLVALKRLRDDLEFRHAVIENGRRRAEETKPENLVKQWQTFVLVRVVPAYERWRNSPAIARQAYLKRCALALKTEPARKGWQKMRNKLGIRTRLRAIASKFKS